MRTTQEKQRYWENHAEAAEKFVGSHEAYCRAEGISAPALRYWRIKARGKRRPIRPLPTKPFVPVEVMYDGPARPKVPDPRWLAELILALTGGAR